MKEIPLSKKGKKNKGKYVAYVDDDVFEEVNQYLWNYHNGYAKNSKMKILLHVFIWNLKFGEIPKGFEIEHWDENGLNNQISNLRLATRSENQCNKTKLKNNTSGVKGISKFICKGHRRKDGTYKEYTYWYAKITKDGKPYYKPFPFTPEGFEQAKNWIKNISLDVQGKFSIYNKPKK